MDTRMSETQEQPLYPHTNCSECRFLGRWSSEEEPGKVYDLYYCAQHGRPTLMARYGASEEEYLSGASFYRTVPPIGEAHRRAGKLGLKLAL
jgi:hypothetical protein